MTKREIADEIDRLARYAQPWMEDHIDDLFHQLAEKIRDEAEEEESADRAPVDALPGKGE